MPPSMVVGVVVVVVVALVVAINVGRIGAGSTRLADDQ